VKDEVIVASPHPSQPKKEYDPRPDLADIDATADLAFANLGLA
jgi:hypothetical protein